MKHVLVLDRSQTTRLELTELLGLHGIRAIHVSDSKHLLGILSTNVIDALLIEITTNELENVIHQLTAVTHAPILIVGAEESIEEDIIRGLDAGASNYICRPVGNQELVARVKAAIRDRVNSNLRQEWHSYKFGDYKLFLRQRLLTHSDSGEIKLTIAEFNLLTVFLASPRIILTREHLLSASRLHEGEISDRSLDPLILRLRRKVEVDPTHPRLIRTVRGSGYIFDGDVAIEVKDS
jgi:DNA-binding response OmpR family regulator